MSFASFLCCAHSLPKRQPVLPGHSRFHCLGVANSPHEFQVPASRTKDKESEDESSHSKSGSPPSQKVGGTATRNLEWTSHSRLMLQFQSGVFSKFLVLRTPLAEAASGATHNLNHPAQASRPFTMLPSTSVRRKSRPWKRKVSLVWSRPSKCRIVAFQSWMGTGSRTML